MTIPVARRRPQSGASTNVIAAVVTYNPGAELSQNLKALRLQVQSVVVIDNGSANYEFVETAAEAAGCQLLRNAMNLGVATALNQAAAFAREHRLEWLATFDQDSLVDPGSIAGLLALWREHPERDLIAIMTMSHRDRGSGADYYFPRDVITETEAWRTLRTTITSGALVRTSALDKVGMFDEKLFVDSVDHEFCLRCRRHGFLIVQGKKQSLVHSVGATDGRKFGPFIVWCSNHSPLRRYYMTRNQLEVAARYLTTDFSWACRAIYHLVGSSIVTLLFESDRIAKLHAMIEGIWDFAFRRFGPRRSAGTIQSNG